MDRLLRLLRSTVKFILFAAILIATLIDGLFRQPKVGVEGSAWISKWCRRLVWATGIKVTVTGTPPKYGALISNHMSYMDILLYSATTPFFMVSKAEIRRWPIVGWLTSRAGTIYIVRGTNRDAELVNAAMAAGFAGGLPVLFFPEGTTSNGTGLLEFRRGLFQSTVDCKVPIHVSALHYSFSAANPGATVQDQVCWHGDASALPHIFTFLGLKGVHVDIRFSDESVSGSTRLEAAENGRAAMATLFRELRGEAEARGWRQVG